MFFKRYIAKGFKFLRQFGFSLLGHLCFHVVLKFDLFVDQIITSSFLFLEEDFIVVDFKIFLDKVIGRISGEERPENHASVDGGNADSVIADKWHRPFLYFLYIAFRDIDKSLTEEDVAGVELWVEAHPVGRYVQPASEDDSVREGTGVALYVFFVGFNCYLFQQKFSMFAVDLSQKDVLVENVGNIILLVCFVVDLWWGLIALAGGSVRVSYFSTLPQIQRCNVSALKLLKLFGFFYFFEAFYFVELIVKSDFVGVLSDGRELDVVKKLHACFDGLSHIILELLVCLSVFLLVIVCILNLVEEGKELCQGLFDVIDKLFVTFLAILVNFSSSLTVSSDDACQVLRILEDILLADGFVLVDQIFLFPLAITSIQLYNLFIDILLDKGLDLFEEIAHQIALLGNIVLYSLDGCVSP